MAKSNFYQIERIENGIRIIYYNGETACELRGGNCILIAMTFASLRKTSEQRADDYLAGVIAGLHHCTATQSIPDIGVPF